MQIIDQRNLSFHFVFVAVWCLSIIAIPASGQFTLRIILSNVAATHQADPIYIAGNFNNWNPGNPDFQFQKQGNKLALDVKNVPVGIYEYKFTRGSWGRAACSVSGADLSNNTLQLKADTTVYDTVKAWKDEFAAADKKHTASKNVLVMDTGFFMPQLARNRKISIYLPAGYSTSKLHYPVMYMHDGQNLFDDYIAGFEEWGVDESLDSLIKKGQQPCIVVAIDNGPNRITEYNPFYFEKFGDGEGDNYINFIVNNLKPAIDKRYRTLTAKNNTIIAGSSMGGLISYYAILKYPEVFGKAGIFSPAFWTSGKGISELTDSLGPHMDGMLFFYMGRMEGDQYLKEMTEVCDKLGKLSTAYIYTAVDEKGLHNEKAWRKWFSEFYKWITADGNNYIIKTPD